MEVVRDLYHPHASFILSQLVSMSFEDLCNLGDAEDMQRFFDGLLSDQIKKVRQQESLVARIAEAGFRQRTVAIAKLIMDTSSDTHPADESSLLKLIKSSLPLIEAAETDERRKALSTHGLLVAHLRDAKPIPMNTGPSTVYKLSDCIPAKIGSIIPPISIPSLEEANTSASLRSPVLYPLMDTINLKRPQVLSHLHIAPSEVPRAASQQPHLPAGKRAIHMISTSPPRASMRSTRQDRSASPLSPSPTPQGSSSGPASTTFPRCHGPCHTTISLGKTPTMPLFLTLT